MSRLTGLARQRTELQKLRKNWRRLQRRQKNPTVSKIRKAFIAGENSIVDSKRFHRQQDVVCWRSTKFAGQKENCQNPESWRIPLMVLNELGVSPDQVKLSDGKAKYNELFGKQVLFSVGKLGCTNEEAIQTGIGTKRKRVLLGKTTTVDSKTTKTGVCKHHQ